MAVNDRLSEFKNLTLFKLHVKFAKFSPAENQQVDDDEAVEKFLVDCGLILSARNCPICNSAMKLIDNESGKRWQCQKGPMCSTEISYLKDSFFENSHLSFDQILRFTYYWTHDMQENDFLAHEVGIGAETVAYWKNYCRRVCREFFKRNSIQIGGLGKVIEIDKCLLIRRKNDDDLEQKGWIFGGVERGSRHSFFVIVQRRNAESTLRSLIRKHIAPGTKIISDSSWADFRIMEMRETDDPNSACLQYEREILVPTRGGARINAIRSIWGKLRQEHKNRLGVDGIKLSSYLHGFMWQKLFKHDPFYSFWKHVRECYPFNDDDDGFDVLDEVDTEFGANGYYETVGYSEDEAEATDEPSAKRYKK